MPPWRGGAYVVTGTGQGRFVRLRTEQLIPFPLPKRGKGSGFARCHDWDLPMILRFPKGCRNHIYKKRIIVDIFLLRRLPGILLPYAIVTRLFWGMYALNGTFYDFLDIVMSMIHGKPIVLFLWYILSILLFYVVYALLNLGACL